MNRTKVGLSFAISCAVAWALVNAYHVEPETQAMSGWTRLPPNPSYFVSEIVTVCFDTLEYVELFGGDYGQGGEYHLSVRTYPGDFPIASGEGEVDRAHSWVEFSDINVTYPESIVKGKKLEFRFTRDGPDSINYYTNIGSVYPYGYMKVGGTDYNGLDLCMRVYGISRVDDSLFGTHLFLLPMRYDWGITSDWCSSPV